MQHGVLRAERPSREPALRSAPSPVVCRWLARHVGVVSLPSLWPARVQHSFPSSYSVQRHGDEENLSPGSGWPRVTDRQSILFHVWDQRSDPIVTVQTHPKERQGGARARVSRVRCGACLHNHNSSLRAWIWWTALYPGVAMFILVLALSFIGEGLDAWVSGDEARP